MAVPYWAIGLLFGVSVLASKRLIAVSQAFVGQRQALLSVDEAVPRAAWCIFPPASLAFLRFGCGFARFTHIQPFSDSSCCARRQPRRNRPQVSVLSYPRVRQKWYDR